MSVPTTIGAQFTAGRPRPLFKFAGVFRVSGNTAAFDIHPDGRRFIWATEPNVPLAQPREITIVQNRFTELQRLAPTR
jgi:hypothetical protein